MVPELATERFELKHILPQDQEFIFEGLSHPQVIPFYGVRYASLEATRAQMEFYEELSRNGTGKWWKIVDKQAGANTGAIGFNNYSPQHNKAEVGYWLLPRHWKKGIIAEVLPIVISYLQKERKVHRIEAFVEEGNVESNKVLERLGFIYEGTMRDCEIKEGKYISLRMYSLLSPQQDLRSA